MILIINAMLTRGANPRAFVYEAFEFRVYIVTVDGYTENKYTHANINLQWFDQCSTTLRYTTSYRTLC